MNSNHSQSLWSHALMQMTRRPVAIICFVIIISYFFLAILCATGLVFTQVGITDHAKAYLPPNADHWWGTDIFGRDVLARAAHGSVTSIVVGLAGAGLAVMLGTFLGSIAGYFGGWVDELIVWFYTTVDTIPYILLIAAFSFLLEPGLASVCLALGLTSWVTLCRVVRAEVLGQRERDYVQSARALGASHGRRLFVHILPNVSHLILVNFSLSFVNFIKAEVILSYLGLGVAAGTPSWGVMINDAKQELARGVWWGFGAATLFMFILVLAFNLFNDALREALDPKSKGKA